MCGPYKEAGELKVEGLMEEAGNITMDGLAEETVRIQSGFHCVQRLVENIAGILVSNYI